MPSTFGGSPPTQPRGERYPIYGDRVIASRLWGAAGYKPHAGQASVHSSRTRNRVVSGGRREGKSEVGAWELFVESILTKGYIRQLEEFRRRREFWIVGPEYSDSEKEFRKLYDALKAKGDYTAAGINLIPWLSMSSDTKQLLWSRMLRGRVANASDFKPAV